MNKNKNKQRDISDKTLIKNRIVCKVTYITIGSSLQQQSQLHRSNISINQ